MRKVFYHRRLSTRLIPEAYQPDPKGRLLWLQRLAQAVLRRWGRHVMMEVENVEQVTIPEPERLLDGIMREIEARVRFTALAREDLAIVVGQQIHHDLIMEMSGHMEIWIANEDGRKIFGVPVFVSAWFDGWIVLPRTAVMRPAERGGRQLVA